MRSLFPPIHVAKFSSFVRAISRAKKATLLLYSVAVLLAGGSAAVRGQSAFDGLNPTTNSVADVVVVQPDGKILIGGGFTTLSPNGGVAVTRSNITASVVGNTTETPDLHRQRFRERGGGGQRGLYCRAIRSQRLQHHLPVFYCGRDGGSSGRLHGRNQCAGHDHGWQHDPNTHTY